ncbi:hypothetical protein FRC00_010304, partial [Tulasnella sp. 408]
MSWVYSRGHPRNRIQDLAASLTFYGTAIPAEITHDQVQTLEPGQYLTADLCSFYCYEVGNAYVEGMHAPGRLNDLVVLHSLTWDLAYWPASPKGVRVSGAPHVFDHKFVAFPGNDDGPHFFLCIIIFPGDLLRDVNPDGPVRTKVFILNSSHGLQPRDPDRKIKNIIMKLAEGRQLREAELQDVHVFLPMAKDPIDGSLDVLWEHEGIKIARDCLKSLILTATKIRQAALRFNTDFPPSSAMCDVFDQPLPIYVCVAIACRRQLPPTPTPHPPKLLPKSQLTGGTLPATFPFHWVQLNPPCYPVVDRTVPTGSFQIPGHKLWHIFQREAHQERTNMPRVQHISTPETSHVMTPVPKFESEPPLNNPEANDQFPRMNDVDQPSDDATITKGV